MATYGDLWEEKASELITVRNSMVHEGADPNSKAVNIVEERASRMLSRAKGKVR